MWEWRALEASDEEILEVLERMEAQLIEKKWSPMDYAISAFLAVLAIGTVWAFISAFTN